MKHSIYHPLMLSFMCFTALMRPALADVTEKDVNVILRVISFVHGMPKGNVEIVAVTDGSTSKNDADKFVSLANGKKGAGITLSAKTVLLENFAASSAKIAFIPEGMNHSFDVISNTASKNKLVTISNDNACSDARKCVISISSGANIDVLVSQSAAKNAGVEFVPMFSLMTTKIP